MLYLLIKSCKIGQQCKCHTLAALPVDSTDSHKLNKAFNNFRQKLKKIEEHQQQFSRQST